MRGRTRIPCYQGKEQGNFEFRGGRETARRTANQRCGEPSRERLTDYALGLYASPAYLDRTGRPASPTDLPSHQFVGYIDDLLYAPELRYLAEIHSNLRVRTTSSSIRAQFELTRAGAGLCVLPHFMAHDTRGLEAVLPATVRLTRTFWISVHRELQDTRRIRIVRNWLLETVEKCAPSLLPSFPKTGPHP